MAKNKKSWDKLKNRQPADDPRYRDVYNDQQMERSDLPEAQSSVPYTIVACILSLLVFGLMWAFVSIYAVGQQALLPQEPIPTPRLAAPVSRVDLPFVNPYWIIDADGNEKADDGKQYASAAEAEEAWYELNPETRPTEEEQAEMDAYNAEIKALEAQRKREAGLTYQLKTFTMKKLLISFCVAFVVYALLHKQLMKIRAAQTAMSDTSDINQWKNDQHIALPEEIMRRQGFDFFPDVGAHSPVGVSSMISHMMVSNKGIQSVAVGQRAEKDVKDEDGEIVYLKGDLLEDEDGKFVTKMLPMFDAEFAEALFDASGLPDDKKRRKYYDMSKVPYNADGKDRDRIGKYKTVADMINSEWTFPVYEPQRPAGVYIVDTQPVNTMV